MKNQALFISVNKLNIQDRSLKRYIEHLRYLALHDPLTELPNRTLFMDRLLTAIKKAKRNGLGLVLLYIDLDKFKSINDNYGHTVGDAVLKHTARILKSCIRESDTTARLGGDEFTILLEDLHQTDIASKIANNIIEKMKRPFRIGNQVLNLNCSIGLAQYPKDATDLELINRADQALGLAKKDGAGTFKWFSNNN